MKIGEPRHERQHSVQGPPVDPPPYAALRLGGVALPRRSASAAGPATTELSGAVVAPGTFVVDSHVKKVQHPTGGVVGEILARDGDRVRAGDVVIRLDETVARANLAMVSKSLDELCGAPGPARGGAGRREGRSLPGCADDRARTRSGGRRTSCAASASCSTAGARPAPARSPSSRSASPSSQEQIDGTKLQASAKARRDRADPATSSIGVAGALEEEPRADHPRHLAQARGDAARGERGQLISTIAQAKGKISETELQIIQIDQDLRSEVSKELREVQAKIAELVERKVAAEDQLKRIDIRAPQDGIVHQSTVHTVGGVIGAGEPLMLVVPEGDELSIEVKVVAAGHRPAPAGARHGPAAVGLQPAHDAGDQGPGQRIAADLVTDERSGMSHYPVRIAFAEGEHDASARAKLLPGMPVEGLHPDGLPHGVLLPDEAARRQHGTGLQGRVIGSGRCGGDRIALNLPEASEGMPRA